MTMFIHPNKWQCLFTSSCDYSFLSPLACHPGTGHVFKNQWQLFMVLFRGPFSYQRELSDDQLTRGQHCKGVWHWW